MNQNCPDASNFSNRMFSERVKNNMEGEPPINSGIGTRAPGELPTKLHELNANLSELNHVLGAINGGILNIAFLKEDENAAEKEKHLRGELDSLLKNASPAFADQLQVALSGVRLNLHAARIIQEKLNYLF